MNNTRKVKFMSWNVRGLNDRDKRTAVKNVILNQAPHIICLQETKLQNAQPRIVKEAVGARATQFLTIPACNTAGGLLVA